MGICPVVVRTLTFYNGEPDYKVMVQRPLVLLATIFAGLLIVLSFALVLMPDMVATLGMVSGVVAVLAIVVLLVMFIRLRKV